MDGPEILWILWWKVFCLVCDLWKNTVLIALLNILLIHTFGKVPRFSGPEQISLVASWLAGFLLVGSAGFYLEGWDIAYAYEYRSASETEKNMALLQGFLTFGIMCGISLGNLVFVCGRLIVNAVKKVASFFVRLTCLAG